MSDKLNLIDTIAKDDKFSTFSRLMRKTNTNDVFKGEGPFTVFVPTNDAFAKIPEALINELINEKDHTRLKSILSYHILPGRVMAASLISSPTRKASNAQELMFTDVNGLKVNGASVQARNVEASNGIIHALDMVLAPPMAPRAAAAKPTSVNTPASIGIGSRTPVALANAPAAATAAGTRSPGEPRGTNDAPKSTN